ncbi:hypothetical protein MU0083_002683 [[Mycobacterium] kokjensenii]|uniref:DUF3298 domain-containing protein n=1 Tax=[Mycobacterium] kokjensenii TaxID=3064287 RepID=A0ABM9LMI2_9MYCO|nr:hypothetical protein [Mycolicibacter sp. MU0083]CAJ1501440.1 hypothetical protein MU0083_002683 [Mycolicibacter sp. MU0083]
MSRNSAARVLASAVLAAAVAALGTACDADGPEPTATTAAPSAAPIGFVETVDGTDGSVTYSAELPQLRDGDAAVRETFNAAMRAALDQHLQPAAYDAPVTVAPGILGESGRSQVSHVGTGAVAGVLLLNIYVDRAAHPYNTVSTLVIDAVTAAPIALTDLFTDPAAGLRAVVAGIGDAIAGHDLLAGQRTPQPVTDQLTDWLPTADGLVIYLSVAHVLGDYYPVLVDWDALADVLKDGMREKLTE